MLWHLHHGSWWMIQWSFDGWFSLGIHIEPRKLPRYGPYVDLHLGCCIVSVGRNPAYSGEFQRSVSVSRGGLA